MYKIELGGQSIYVNFYEGYKEKATITVDTSSKQKLDFLSIINLFNTSDIEKLTFYQVKQEMNNNNQLEETFVYHGELNGYTKLLSYTNNIESEMGTIILEKPNVNNMSLDEVKNVMNEQIETYVKTLMNDPEKINLLLAKEMKNDYQ